jgi:hypothetical protein
MIGLVLALALQGAVQQDADALLMQATDRIFDAEEALAYTLGRCASIYPAGSGDPFVIEAREGVEELGMEPLTKWTIRLRQVRYAEGVEAGPEKDATARTCLQRISDEASDLDQHVAGMRGLIQTLSQRR